MNLTKPESLELEVQAYLDNGGKAHDKTSDGIDFVYWGCRKVYIVNGRAYRLKAKAKKEHTQ
jgi:hypothetical protein